MIDVVPFEGWTRVLRIRNATTTLLITLEVGPRILSYTFGGGTNPLKVYPDQAGRSGETEWRIRGGHRLWVAPEDRTTTYVPDNAAVTWTEAGPNAVRLRPPPESTTGLQKELTVTLDPAGSGVTLVHRIERLDAAPMTLAPWALTVMAPGGLAVIPQPPLGEHPRDLLPNRRMILWPYTDLTDPRWQLGPKYLRLRQDPARGPTKLGLRLAAGCCGYLLGNVFFVKRFACDPAANYPDDGCNFEVFTGRMMLELESLGPLATLSAGQAVEHTERWELHPAGGSWENPSESDLDRLAGPIFACPRLAP